MTDESIEVVQFTSVQSLLANCNPAAELSICQQRHHYVRRSQGGDLWALVSTLIEYLICHGIRVHNRGDHRDRSAVSTASTTRVIFTYRWDLDFVSCRSVGLVFVVSSHTIKDQSTTTVRCWEVIADQLRIRHERRGKRLLYRMMRLTFTTSRLM